MHVTLLLPWFPIILAVGVGGRLLGKVRGLGLGFLCALFWIVLVQASEGPAVWRSPWALIAGAAAVVARGGWSGAFSGAGRTRTVGPTSQRRGHGAGRQGVGSERAAPWDTAAASVDETSAIDAVAVALRQFDEWLAEHVADTDPWPKFDDFIRATLHTTCRTTHVRPYRLLPETQQLTPLGDAARMTEPVDDASGQRLSVRKGIVGHVAMTGRAYIAEDATQGELLQQLAEESQDPPAWCFPVCHGQRRLGVVVVGHLGVPPARQRKLMDVMAGLIGQFWGTLLEAVTTRSAQRHDPVSGLLTRDAFLVAADRAVRAAYRRQEPVAVAVVAVEDLRRLNDAGRWAVADELIGEVGACVRRRLRFDDCFGRFDGSRVMLLLRRVDSGLASLIVGQLMCRVQKLCADEDRWGVSVTARCGVVGSGVETPPLEAMIFDAVALCHRARRDGVLIASDLRPVSDRVEPLAAPMEPETA
ncbi:MAG: diguanylate cyclase domain-containing protein [Phycisphaerae bacterium]